MKNKIPIILTGLLLFNSTTIFASDSENILNAIEKSLQKYCVPPNGYNCDPSELATYTDGKCIPDYPDHFWVPKLRLAKELKCQAGYRRVYAEKGVCPAGTRKVWIPSKNTNLCKIHNFIQVQQPTTNNDNNDEPTYGGIEK